mmetsp:Transcript_3000/g.7421  ORF Transcript_3000/g.7421 Transcript_3000/m.7421 type:complete len:208 (+) Transcript_3000:2678-3301(+)
MTFNLRPSGTPSHTASSMAAASVAVRQSSGAHRFIDARSRAALLALAKPSALLPPPGDASAAASACALVRLGFRMSRFSGFMSLCTTFLSCMNAMNSSSCLITMAACLSLKWPVCTMASSRGSAGMYSSTMWKPSGSSKMSTSSTMLRWPRHVRMVATLVIMALFWRLKNLALPRRMTLTATTRLLLFCTPLYTRANAPRPSSSVVS